MEEDVGTEEDEREPQENANDMNDVFHNVFSGYLI